MSSEHEAVIRKVRQLLALSQSANEHESRAATLAADLLIQKHRLSEAQLQGDSPGRIGSTVVTLRLVGLWRNVLLSRLARQYGCAVVQDRGGGIRAWGRPDDLSLLGVMFERLTAQVDRLTVNRCAGKGRSYADSYRKGCVMALYELLDKAKAQAAEGAPGQAIVRLDARESEAAEARDAELGGSGAIVRGGKPREVTVNPEAFRTGQEDGRHIHLGESIGDAVRAPRRLQ
jgi:hypothetical protein